MKFLKLLVGLALPLSIAGAAYAQTDESQFPPTDYGAGYKIVIFHQHLEHAPGAGDDYDGQGPIKLDISYPLIVSPLTPEAKEYNAKMQQMAAIWWANMRAPEDNKTQSDPNVDYSLDCEPVGLQPPVDNYQAHSDERMLSGVVSMACENYIFFLGAAHGGGENWGFNWLMRAGREVRASDVFDTKTRWLPALTAAVNAYRGYPGSGGQTLDFSDTSHWVVENKGLGITYSMAELSGAEDGGMGSYDFIPWSKLAPYLRKDGIVPQADWSAAGVRDLFPAQN